MKRLAAISVVAGFPFGLPAQQASTAAPVHPVAATSATSTETLGAIRGIRALPDGRVIVNDPTRRRLLLFEPTLASYAVLIDSTPGRANSYPRSISGFIPYSGDSSIFVDYTAQTFLVYDEKGKEARVTAPPKPSETSSMISSPGVDAKGQILYRGYIRPPIPTTSAGGMPAPSQPIDSAAIVRADWDTGSVDTLAKFRISTPSRLNSTTNAAGARMFNMTINPLTQTDDWTVTSDGRVAIVRGHDYHIDWIGLDGKLWSSPKMPYDWRRLTDDDKNRMMDSVRHLYDSIAATPEGGVRSTSTINGVMTTTTTPIKYDYVPISQIPDYYPPLRITGSVLADRDGNVWILPYTSAQGAGKGLVYDVVNAKGDVVDKVQLPEGRSIVGFGKGGVIYMMNPAPVAKAGDRPGSAGFYLERTTLGTGGAIKPSP